MVTRLAMFGLVVILVAACGSSTPSAAPTTAAVASTTPTTVATAAASIAPTIAPTRSPRPTATPATATPCPGTDSTPNGKPATDYRETQTQWAGHVVFVKKRSISCVEGTWFQPKARCGFNSPDSVFVGIGMDGYASFNPTFDATNTNLMIGVETYCSNGGRINPRAWKWSEEKITDLGLEGIRVAEGDRVWARILYENDGYTIELVDLTNGTSASRQTGVPAAKRLTAEWVISTLLDCSTACKPAPLARFPELNFIDGAVSLDGGYRSTIRDDKWGDIRVTLEPKQTVLARPGALLGDGASFAITWVHA